MRRWFEFGVEGGIVGFLQGNPLVELDATDGRIFVSMPHKARLQSVLNGPRTTDSREYLTFLQVVNQDQGVDPADDCDAQHIPRIWSYRQTIINPITQWFISGFPTVGFGFTEPMIEINSEPPSEFGG